MLHLNAHQPSTMIGQENLCPSLTGAFDPQEKAGLCSALREDEFILPLASRTLSPLSPSSPCPTVHLEPHIWVRAHRATTTPDVIVLPPVKVHTVPHR